MGKIDVIIGLQFENDVKRKALIDRGACGNAMQDFYEKVEYRRFHSEIQQARFLNVKVASGPFFKVLGQIDVKYKFHEHYFEDTSFILPSKISVVGNPFFRKHSFDFIPAENLLILSGMTYELNEKNPGEGPRTSEKTF